MAQGNRCEQVIEMKAGTREMLRLLIHPAHGQPVRTGKEVRQHSEIDLRVDGIPQEETYSDQQYMDDIKKQMEKLQG